MTPTNTNTHRQTAKTLFNNVQLSIIPFILNTLNDYAAFLPMLLFGFLAGYIDGAIGMGFGVTSSSLILTMGIAPAIVSASVHTAKVFSALFAGISHWRFGNIRKDIVIPLIAPGVIGGIVGAALISYIPSHTAKPIIALFLFLVGLIIFLRYLIRKNVLVVEKPISKSSLTTVGFIAAFCDATAGGGWGPIATPSLIMTNRSEPRKVIGSVNASEFFIALAQTTTFLITLGPLAFHWTWVLALLIGGAVAAPLAAYTCKKVPSRWLGLLVGVILMVSNSLTLLHVIGGMS